MITTFISYLRTNRGLAENTCRSYEKALRSFVNYISVTDPSKRWSTITKADIDDYVKQLVELGMKPATIKQQIAALRTFYKTVMALGYINDNPARYVSTPKLEEALPKTIEPEAIAAALNASTTDRQAKAVIAIIFETGMRLQEVLDMKREDIDSAHQAITVFGKGGKQRVVYYGDLTKKYGGKWRPARYSQRDVRRLVYDALKPYSHAQQLSPHALRHTYASCLLNNGMDIHTIQQLLGHTHIETTEIYAKLTNEHTRNLYSLYHPTL